MMANQGTSTNRLMKISISILAAITWVGVFEASANLLQNPGFDNGTSWATWGKTQIANWGNSGYYGTGDDWVAAFDGWTNLGGGIYQSGIIAQENCRYYYRIVALKETDFANCDIEIKLEYHESDDTTKIGETLLTTDSATITANTWTRFEMSSAVSNGAAYVRPVMYFPDRQPTESGSQAFKWDVAGLYNRTLNYAPGEIVDEFSYDPLPLVTYTNGLDGKNRGNGFSGAWSTTLNGGLCDVDDGDFVSVASYPTNHGNKLCIQSANQNISYAVRSFDAITNGKVYASAYMNIDWADNPVGNWTGKYSGVSFMNGSTELGFFGEIAGINTNIGLTVFPGGTNQASSYYVTEKQDYLIVGCYDFETRELKTKTYVAGSTPDTLPAEAPVSWDATATLAPDQITQIDGIRLACGVEATADQGAARSLFDEVRVAPTWERLMRTDTSIAKVTFEGYPSGSGLDGLSAPSDFGMSGAWIADANATAVISNQTLIYTNGNVRIDGGTNALFLVGNGTSDDELRILESALTPGEGVVRYIGYLYARNGNYTTASRCYVALDDNTTTTTQLAGGGTDKSYTTNNYAQVGSSKEYAGTQPAEDEIYYFVTKLEAGASGWTNVTVYVNPSDTETETADTTYSVSDAGWNNAVTNLIVRHNASTVAKYYYIDQIVIGDSWGDVVYSNSGPTLVVLWNFTVSDEDDEVVVRWRTASEVESLGFIVERYDGKQWVAVSDFVEAQGGEVGASYAVVDETAVPGGTYTYRLAELETDGDWEYYGPYDRTATALVMDGPLSIVPGGVMLRWLSREDEAYDVERAEDLNVGYEIIAEAIPATPPENEFIDTDVGSAGFYRIKVNGD